jgi:GR25 family glycosyltransferase involved in LPS biosynthesis
MDTFVISLENPIELLGLLKKYDLNPILFNGFNINTANKDKYKKHFNNIWFQIAPSSTIGCALSHLHLWKQFLNSKNEYAIIFEDDVIFEDNFSKEYILEMIKYTPSNFDILYLGCFNSTFFKYFGYIVNNNKSKQINHYIEIPKIAFGTHAYIISKNGANKLIKLLDGNIFFHLDICIQNLCKKQLLNSFSTNPRLVYQTSTDFNYKLKSNNISNNHPFLFQKFLSNFYIDKHVSANYITSVSIIKFNNITFNLTSVIFIFISLLCRKIDITTLTIIFIIISLLDLLQLNIINTSLHYLLLILPKIIF